jgi:hypothetical protein
MPSRSLHSLSLVAACFSIAVAAHADSIVTATSVAATAVVYAAGNQSGLAPNVGGTAPTALNVLSGSTCFTFLVPNGKVPAQMITLNGGSLNDADGIGAATSSSSNSGYGSISGIRAANAGYLTGVFVGANGPSGSAPNSLDFTGVGGTSFTSLNPLLDQVFFIGDGLTGDGTGTTQQFYVPTGATTLYLGISDAGGYNGGPGSYSDNSGSFSLVDVNDVTGGGGGGSTAVTPEPSSLVLLGTGVLSVAGMRRRRTMNSR